MAAISRYRHSRCPSRFNGAKSCLTMLCCFSRQTALLPEPLEQCSKPIIAEITGSWPYRSLRTEEGWHPVQRAPSFPYRSRWQSQGNPRR